MMDSVQVRRGTYHDSVRLMQASRALQLAQGVEEALVAMATDLNRELLAGMGFDVSAIGEAGLTTSSSQCAPPTSKRSLMLARLWRQPSWREPPAIPGCSPLRHLM